MTKRLTLFLVCALLLGYSNTFAQKGKLTFAPTGGASSYQGDNNPAPNDKDGHIQDYFKNLGPTLGLELEYGLGNRLGIATRVRYGIYNNIEESFANPKNGRLTADALLRFYFLGQDKAVTPYINIGYNIITGSKQDPYTRKPGSDRAYSAAAPVFNGRCLAGADCFNLEKKSLGMGPEVGWGLLFNVGKARLGLEANGFWSGPDVAADGANPTFNLNGGKVLVPAPKEAGDISDYDYFNFIGAKLLLNLSEGNTCRPALITGLNAASSGNINTPVNFSGMVDPNATMPVSYMWDFGDGTTATGMNVSHTFSKPGTYAVTFSATNCKGTDTKTITPPFTVNDPCSANKPTASVAGATALKTNESGSFSASGSGSGVTYSWNFGDGTTGSGARASHSFSRAGTYNVTATATNSCGAATSSAFRVTVTEPVVTPPTPVDPCSRISELNSVYFDFRSSRLDDAAKSLLDENVTVLKDCPNLKVNVTGYSDTDENSMTIAAQRARAIYDYYISKGIAASRLTSSGAGIDPAPTKEDPGPGNRRGRRGESAPMR